VSEEMKHTSSASSTSMAYSFKDARSFLIFCKEKDTGEVEIYQQQQQPSLLFSSKLG
jgi:hypothetical protein